MALVKCRDCGNEMSTSAAACPKCGAPSVQQQNIARVRDQLQNVAAVFTVGVLLFGAYGWWDCSRSIEKVQEVREKAAADELAAQEKAAASNAKLAAERASAAKVPVNENAGLVMDANAPVPARLRALSAELRSLQRSCSAANRPRGSTPECMAFLRGSFEDIDQLQAGSANLRAIAEAPLQDVAYDADDAIPMARSCCNCATEDAADCGKLARALGSIQARVPKK